MKRKKPALKVAPSALGIRKLVPREASARERAEPEVLAAGESPRRDALQLYLREIGQVKLLTPKEEIELARRIQRGDKHAR